MHMSRSYRKNPVTGFVGDTNKWDKVLNNRTKRAGVTRALRAHLPARGVIEDLDEAGEAVDKVVLGTRGSHDNPYVWNNDGKLCMFRKPTWSRMSDTEWTDLRDKIKRK